MDDLIWSDDIEIWLNEYELFELVLVLFLNEILVMMVIHENQNQIIERY
jgi:hypothetical protein